MNLKLIIFLTVLGMGTIIGCEGFLDVKPTNGLTTKDAITDIITAKAALNGVYDLLQSRYYYGTDLITWGDVRGEDMGTTLVSDRTSSQNEFSNLTALNYIGYFWEYQYAALNRVNILLSIINDNGIIATPSEQDELHNIHAQALALRALIHFDVLRIHAEPYLKNKDAWGAVILTKVIAATDKPKRSTVAATYDQIIADLQAAILKFPVKINKESGYINVWGAKSLLARVYLYKGDWANAWTNATDVITNGGYSLIPNNKYVSSWFEEITSESIFEIKNIATDNANRESIGYLFYPRGGDNGGYGAVSATKTLVDLVRSDPNDVRNEILKKNDRGFDGGFVVKYPGRGGDKYVNNIRVVRLSDVYLIAAEAAMNVGTAPAVASARKYLNEIRKRANPSLADINPSLDLIEIERRKELVGEGHRFFDINRKLGNKKVIRTGTTSYPLASHQMLELSWNNQDTYRLIQPIQQEELFVNPEIQQNAGY